MILTYPGHPTLWSYRKWVVTHIIKNNLGTFFEISSQITATEAPLGPEEILQEYVSTEYPGDPHNPPHLISDDHQCRWSPPSDAAFAQFCMQEDSQTLWKIQVNFFFFFILFSC
jgi:hypothetical protein